ncbi:lantibiotic dehydratase [Actinomadura graeca]|uniref:Lantibiotic dehydratase n=1 Tax=Actinomadura graeca TaxID=2750812 RepID=A0ABX8QUQ9_9ACTN|nr:lantibiotic dehydratase [Actinomadura graeca]QXJ22483.1 lantibiotic dehydratase [Actinomadura graeca]
MSQSPAEARPPLFEPWPAGMLRAPVLPAAFRLDPLPGAPGSPGVEDAARLLRAAVSDARFMAALELASPDLVRGVRSVLDETENGTATGARAGGDAVRVALAVHRYARRAATRPTPFGLFAGVTSVAFAGNTKVVWSDPAGHRVVARADNAVLARLTRVLELDGAVLWWLRVQTHQLVETHGDRVVMPNPTNPDIDPGSDGRAVTSVRATPVVLAALGLARRPVAVHELAAALLARFARATDDAVLRLVRGLVAEQVLVTELRPRLGPGDRLAETHAVLRRVDREAAAAHAGGGDARVGDPEVRARLDALDRVVRALPAAEPEEAVRLLRDVRGAANAHTNSAVHVDLRLGHRVQLPMDVASEGARAAEVLWRLAPPLLGTPALRGYHAEFVERYGLGRLVPVKELLDADRGLGAPAGYSWPPGPRGGAGDGDPSQDAPGVRPPGIARLLTSLLWDAVRDGRREVVLDDALLDALCEGEHDPDSAPPGFELYLHVVAADEAAVDRGDLRLVVSPNPGSHLDGSTFGRFGDVLPEAARGTVAACVRDSARGEALPVVVRYEPRHARSGNIARDPGWTDTRLSVGVAALPDSGEEAGGPEEIDLDDIAVGASLGGLYAVHAPSGRIVRPVFHNMLNVRTQAPNAVRLLCEIAFEHHQMWSPWDWSAMGAAPYLPRVRYGRTVLWSASWSLEPLRPDAADPARFAAALADWRDRWAVPARILATSNDQRIRLDLRDGWDVELLRNELKRGMSLVAQEVPGGEDFADGWFSPGDAARGGGTGGDAARDGEAGYVAEIVLPVRRREPDRRPRPTWAPLLTDRPRAVQPGAGWLYAKLYMAPERSDVLVRDHLPELVGKAAALGGVDRWFFIRYTDPGFHIRLRLHGDAAVLNGPVLSLLHDTVSGWERAGLAGRLVLDAYDPEYERYGGPEAMDAAERFFQADSETAMGLLRLAREHGLDPVDLAAIGVTALVHAWGGPVAADDRAAVGTRWLHDPVAAWMSTTGPPHDVPPGFRRDRHRRAALIDPAGGWPGLRELPGGPAVLDLLGHRDATLTAYRDVARNLVEPWTPESRIVGSLLHMHCNRIIGAGGLEREAAAMSLARACALHHAERRRHTRKEDP